MFNCLVFICLIAWLSVISGDYAKLIADCRMLKAKLKVFFCCSMYFF